MNYRSFYSLVAGMVLALAVLAPGQAQAQSTIDECPCGHVTLSVDANVQCRVDFVFFYPGQPTSTSFTVVPGTQIQVPCQEETEVTVLDCMDHKNYLGVDGCLHNFAAEAGCCVEICMTKDAEGCYQIVATPSSQRCDCL